MVCPPDIPGEVQLKYNEMTYKMLNRENLRKNDKEENQGYACQAKRRNDMSLLLLQVAAVVKGNPEEELVRKKREWILPPKPLKENEDYRNEEFIAKVSHRLLTLLQFCFLN